MVLPYSSAPTNSPQAKPRTCKNARIGRPKTKIEGIDSIIKNDQLKTRIDKEYYSNHNPLLAVRLIGRDTLEDFARSLAAAHKPVSFDWPSRFGLAFSIWVVGDNRQGRQDAGADRASPRAVAESDELRQRDGTHRRGWRKEIQARLRDMRNHRRLQHCKILLVQQTALWWKRLLHGVPEGDSQTRLSKRSMQSSHPSFIG